MGYIITAVVSFIAGAAIDHLYGAWVQSKLVSEEAALKAAADRAKRSL